MPVLHIPVGIPGCGKSFISDVIAPFVVSSDQIRLDLTGDVTDQSRNGEVFAEFHRKIEAYLRSGYSVFADATNLDRGARAELRRIAEKADAHTDDDFDRWGVVETHLILFRNVEQAIQRNADRERVVPADVMLRMIDKYERAIQDIAQEPYDFVTEVTANR